MGKGRGSTRHGQISSRPWIYYDLLMQISDIIDVIVKTGLPTSDFQTCHMLISSNNGYFDVTVTHRVRDKSLWLGVVSRRHTYILSCTYSTYWLVKKNIKSRSGAKTGYHFKHDRDANIRDS